MTEDGSERGSTSRGNGGFSSMDSMESHRWVFQDEEDSEIDHEDKYVGEDDDFTSQHDIDSEDEDSLYHKLIRTGPRIDSFGVEALEVPGAHRSDFEDGSLGKSIFLVFQTLGVVFGDVGTSPLYTFSVMFSRAPIERNEDIIGALSLVLYTLILIPLIKYILIVLLANDDGEGGTFALYSLICRHAKVSLLPNQLASDTRISSFRLKVPSAELERSLKIKEHLETSVALKKLLLVLVLAVISAVRGLKVGVPTVEQDHVVMISVAYLIALFSVQKYGTSKVGLVIGPALFIWFCSLGGIGIYNLVKHDSSVVKAFNPVHIFYYFKNSSKAWYALGGCLLCATGSEAMFADLCYFPVRTIQLTFVFLVLPCLMLGYLGQAAYLMDNAGDPQQAFFSSIPGVAELGVMMMTTVLVTLVMLLIWQINIIIVVLFSLIFLGLELVFFSSVLSGIGDGSWIILVFAIVIFLIMCIWNYGSKLKYETEVKKKMSMDVLRQLGCNLGTVRAPGIGLLYNELVKGVPAIFGHFLTTLPAVHSMIIFVCIKYVPVPVVPQHERFLFRRVCSKSYHIFRCIARYGYKDVRKENQQIFEQLLIESLEKFIRREAQERSLESDGDEDTEDEEEPTKILIGPNGSVYFGVPDGRNNQPIISEATTSSSYEPEKNSSDPEQSLENELAFLHKAKESGVVYLLGHGDIRAKKESWFIKKLIINYFYAFMRKNCRRGIATLSVPHTHLIQVAMTYMV
ncbi:potassium transporter [Cynara cardunculus var. scolymus]|uniref:Potassium transporter n=1 Tax=Cynara cardunculus var. scolymus TaxID=59895 RepID=A0A118K113_CYNCS|nr:potassium transporter [Cynara cardunculus var. scolymus]